MKTLVIYFTNGTTAFFQKVTDPYQADGGLHFGYYGKTRNTLCKAHFQLEAIAGISISDDLEIQVVE